MNAEAALSPAEPSRQRLANPLLRYLAATRPAFILASVSPILLGLAYTLYMGHTLHGVHAVLTLLAGVLLHAAVNVLNDYYDDRNGTDARNTTRIYPFTGGSRFIQNGVLSRRQMLGYGLGLLSVAILIGLYLVSQTGPALLGLGLAGVLIGWGYSASPLSLNSRGLGELAVLAGFSLLPLGAYLVQTGTLSGSLWLVSLPLGLLTTNLLYINQFPDRAADIQAGKCHWVARLTPRTARWGYVLIALPAWLLLAALLLAGRLPPLAWLAMLPVVPSFRAAQLLLAHADQPARLAPAIVLTILALLAHGGLLSLALALAPPAIG